MHESVTSLGSGCFQRCEALTSIAIPSSITTLETECFAWCGRLSSASLPENLTSLGDYCFLDCYELRYFTVPKSVTYIGNRCFYDCINLLSIFMMPDTPPTTGQQVFTKSDLKTVYVVDENAKALYQAAAPWNQYRIVVMPTGIDNVQKDAPRITHLYDLSGKPLNGHQHGPVIVRYNDGSTHKVLLK